MKQRGNPTGTLLGSAVLGWFMSSLTLVIILKLLADQSNHPTADQVVAIGLMMVAYALPLTLVASLLLGWTWFVHASKRNVRSQRAYVVAGLLRGAGVGFIMSLWLLFPFGIGWWPWVLIGTLYSGVIGTFTGAYVWLIRRPDRDPPNPANTTP